jgi:small-conductance mechanosensitive channel
MLEQSFYGNSVLHWLIAAGLALVAALLLLLVRARAVRWLEHRPDGPHARRTASALAALRGTQPWFLIAVGIFVGAQFVVLVPKADRLVDHLALIATIGQSALWASKAIRAWLAHQVAAKRETDAGAATTVSVLGFFAQLGLWSVVVLLVLENLGFNITALLAGLGIGGVAVALATQSILGDVFASIIIALDRPFAIGDFVVLENMMGTVEDIGLKTTRLRSISGEQIVIANADLLKSRLRNFERLRQRRVEFTLGLALDTPAEKLARVPDILREAIEAQPNVRFERAHFKEFRENRLHFEAAFYVSDPDYNRYLDVQQAINLAVYGRLQQEGIAPVKREPPAEPSGGARPESNVQPEDGARARERGAARDREKIRPRQHTNRPRERQRTR